MDLSDGSGASPLDRATASDGTLEAIVAHGLIGSLSVATGSASMLLKAPGRFDAATEQWLVESIQEQATLVIVVALGVSALALVVYALRQLFARQPTPAPD